jgi:hypothetical protein
MMEVVENREMNSRRRECEEYAAAEGNDDGFEEGSVAGEWEGIFHQDGIAALKMLRGEGDCTLLKKMRKTPPNSRRIGTSLRSASSPPEYQAGQSHVAANTKNPHPNPLPEYRARGKRGTCDCPGVPGEGIGEYWERG